MRVVIIGAGKVGFSLAQMMTSEGHDVIVVEQDSQRGAIINDKLDVQVVGGNGASPKLQKMIKMQTTDLVIAVTDSDEVNVLACMFAKQSGVPKTVARVRNVEYASDSDFMNNSHLGVDVFINPEQVTAEAISHYIKIPEAKNINYFDNKQLVMVELLVGPDNPMIGVQLKDTDKRLPYLVTAIIRQNSFIIPNGFEAIQEGDYIFLMSTSAHLLEVERILGFHREKVENVMILGGGRLGYYLASLLEKTDVHVKIVEKDMKRCEYLSAMLNKTVVLSGDASDTDILQEEGISQVDTLVTSTEDDKLNVLVCLLGSQLGAKKTIAQIRRSDYLPLIESVGIDVSVSPRILTCEAILKYVRKGNIESLTLIESGDAEVIDFIVTERHRRLIGKQIKDINFPKGSIISSIDRKERIFIPNGSDEILAGDRITIFAMKQSVRKVEKLINI